ncbi:hypothetical protein phiAS5_ORF0186 [Aeromonas phage phiAS5]|uniref:Uncharacterized protein n=1 Tax=Aeromonas phage phiAS5 TaxID=879630 RepID=E1A2T3_9CAUD|nr:hypothetical protein phiAS5_ORF0186 [Aeromonas phage phiAS5]ADM80029.1 hypothetical protein phiAS5_ORF0186 [Aeromonas phage phiAS5]
MKTAIEQMVKEMNEFGEHQYWDIVVPRMRKEHDEEHVKTFLEHNLNRNKYSVEYGKKNARIVMSNWSGSAASVVWFVDMTTGDILKAASWKAASKYVRGHVSDWKKAMNPASANGYYGFIAIRSGR